MSGLDQGIHTRAILVRLRCGYYNFKREDKSISRKTRKRYKATAGRWIKDLLPGSKEFSKLKRKYGELRTWFYYNTLPWEDRGARLRSTREVEKFIASLNKKVLLYHECRDAFIPKYPELIYKAREQLGDSWKAEDYPHPSTIASKFWAQVGYYTIPNVDDLRLNMSEDQQKVLEEQIRESSKEMFEKAMTECWGRLHEVVSHMASRLSNPEAIIRDSVVGNIQELVDILPGLNISDDPELEAMRKEVQSKLTMKDPQEIRESDKIRHRLATEAKKLASRIESRSVVEEEDTTEDEETLEEMMEKMDGLYG
jgi:orotate phosphoribosyltransferase-like protein